MSKSEKDRTKKIFKLLKNEYPEVEIALEFYNPFQVLIQLPGVGRKTASVVAGNSFGIPAIAVDTHVKRLSNLLGFIKSEDPEKIEFRLKELLPEKDWVASSHLLA